MFIVIVDERVSHQNFCGRRSKPINLNKYKAYIYTIGSKFIIFSHLYYIKYFIIEMRKKKISSLSYNISLLLIIG